MEENLGGRRACVCVGGLLWGYTGDGDGWDGGVGNGHPPFKARLRPQQEGRWPKGLESSTVSGISHKIGGGGEIPYKTQKA